MPAPIFDGPKFEHGRADRLPFAQRQLADARQLLVIIRQRAIILHPRHHQQTEVRAIFLAGEVLGVRQIVGREQR